MTDYTPLPQNTAAADRIAHAIEHIATHIGQLSSLSGKQANLVTALGQLQTELRNKKF